MREWAGKEKTGMWGKEYEEGWLGRKRSKREENKARFRTVTHKE